MDHAKASLLLTADQRLTDAVGAAAAALGVGLDVVSTVAAALSRWEAAHAVLVGDDRAAQLAVEAPARRERAYLVGFDHSELASWSLPLGAEVIALPEGSSWLSAVLAQDDEGAGGLVTLLGGSGGVGTSTLAAGLALVASRRGLTAALVDLDPHGGGIDLVLGAERSRGWRWPHLAGARGEVGDVRRMLPAVNGVTVMSASRGVEAGLPSGEAVQAVMSSLARHHDLVVVDAGRVGLHSGRRPRLAGPTLLVCGTAVRAVASATCAARHLQPDEPRLIVRAGPGSGAPPDLVAEAVGVPLLGRLPDAPALRADAEAGEPPGRRRSKWTRSVEAILTAVTGADGRGD